MEMYIDLTCSNSKIQKKTSKHRELSIENLLICFIVEVYTDGSVWVSSFLYHSYNQLHTLHVMRYSIMFMIHYSKLLPNILRLLQNIIARGGLSL